MSAPIYASVSGTVKTIETRRVVTGDLIQSIVIDNDGLYESEEFHPYAPVDKLQKEEIIDIVKEAGIVGMGGAGFPTHVKLSPKDPDKIEYVIANCAECEPYLTSDYRRMMEDPEKLVEGMRIALKLFDNAKGVFGVENNKPDCIEKLKELVWVNWSLAVYFIAFNMYFTHLGNYMIYYLGFTADMMGYMEGIGLVLAMLAVIPSTKIINQGKIPGLCQVAVFLNCIGVGMLGLFVRPENVNTQTLWNPVLLLGIFVLGLGYMLFLQAITVWGKQLYPEDARGQFEGIRIVFFVLIPMIVAPMISNPIIMRSGKFVDSYGFTEYLPTHTLLIVGAVLVLLTLIPLAFAKKYYIKRIK